MINAIIPKLPMRNKSITKAYYIQNLGFTNLEGQIMNTI